MRQVRSIFLLALLLSRGLWAVDTPEEAAQKAYLANINALMVFTTRDGLNSGTYHFTKANTTMNVIHLPFAYHFEPVKRGWNFFLSGTAGYSETTMTREVNSTDRSTSDAIELTLTNMLQTFAGGIGGGLRYKDESGIAFKGGAEVILSRVGTRIRDDTEAGEIIDDFFTGKFNTNLSYRIFALAEYRRQWFGFTPYAKLSYELFETKSSFNFEQLSTFSSQTNVTSFAVGAESPSLVSYHGMYLTLEGYLRGSYLAGDITDVAKLDGYGTVGGTAYWYVSEAMNYFRRFYLEISTIQADGLQGYNIGLGFSLE